MVTLSAILAACKTPPPPKPEPNPRKPSLDRDAVQQDERDWRAYLACGIRTPTDRKGDACFYWASRLDPSRPEPYYAQWIFSLNTDTASLRTALLLDPFIFHARILVLEGRKPGIFTPRDRQTWTALEAGDYYNASRGFTRHLAEKPGDYEAWWGSAIAHYYRQNFDSSAMQLRILERMLRTQQERRLSVYESLDYLTHMQAAAYQAGRRPDSARAALERTLVENLAFYHARIRLADLAMQRGDTAAAELEWDVARQLYGTDWVAHRRYATFLASLGRYADAERELRTVLAGEPHWVDAYRALAILIEAQGAVRCGDAIVAHEAFLRRAPAEPVAPVDVSRARLDRLRKSCPAALPPR